MNDPRLEAIQAIIRADIGRRGLGAGPADNLISRTRDDFASACHCLASAIRPVVSIVTGFYIAHAVPPCGETDGPLGAVFLARALVPLGFQINLVSDPFCLAALEAGLKASGLAGAVSVVDVSSALRGDLAETTHWIALERAGPSHTRDSLVAQVGTSPHHVAQFEQTVPVDEWDRCHSMRGRDITDSMAPAHRLFESRQPTTTAIGIGDGGNEIGMGKIPWHVIGRNIPNGGLIACRVPTDHLIVAGISNWGAYGLAAGVRCLRGTAGESDLFDVEREREILTAMVERGPLVDGVSGQPTVSVDGQSFDKYVEALREIGQMCSA
jgi:hypothetical protein